MPAFCCVVGCGNRGERDNVGFFRIPSVTNFKHREDLNHLSINRRQAWLSAIRRQNFSKSKQKNARICSKHFVSGRPATLKDSCNPDWIPTLKMGYEKQQILSGTSKMERYNRKELCIGTMNDPGAKRPKMEEVGGNEVHSPSPKKTCNLTTQKFSAIIGLEAFVDKTLFIKAFLEAEDDMIVILAPRKFGKSTNMDMVIEFVTGNNKLFEDNQLKIFKYEREFFYEHCQKNPIIHVDFKNVGGKTEDEVLQSLKKVICRAFNDHKYLIYIENKNFYWSDRKLTNVGTIEQFEKYWKRSEDLSRCDVINGLKDLSHCLNLYYGKPVYAFIDEYDAPIIEAIMKAYPGDGVLNEIINLIRGVTSTLLRGNEHVKKGLINACVGCAEILAGDNVKYYEFLRRPKFAPYFGFTDEEVNSLFEKNEFVTLKNVDVQNWYSGYNLFHTKEYVIYNSYSVLEYLQKSKEINIPLFSTYWVDSGSISNLKELFAETEIRRLIEDLIDGEEVEITITKFSIDDIINLQHLIHNNLSTIGTFDAHLFLQFLAENGYLNVISAGLNKSTLLAPNNEIKELLKAKCYNAQFFQHKYQLSSEKIRNYGDALDSLLQQRDRNVFTKFAKAVSELFDGALMPKDTDEFYGILYTLAYHVKNFGVCSEVNVHRTKIREKPHHFDLLVILGQVGMILGLKFEVQSSEEVHTEMSTQDYVTPEVTPFIDDWNVTVNTLLALHMTKERKVSLTYTNGSLAEETVTSSD